MRYNVYDIKFIHYIYFKIVYYNFLHKRAQIITESDTFLQSKNTCANSTCTQSRISLVPPPRCRFRALLTSHPAGVCLRKYTRQPFPFLFFLFPFLLSFFPSFSHHPHSFFYPLTPSFLSYSFFFQVVCWRFIGRGAAGADEQVFSTAPGGSARWGSGAGRPESLTAHCQL